VYKYRESEIKFIFCTNTKESVCKINQRVVHTNKHARRGCGGGGDDNERVCVKIKCACGSGARARCINVAGAAAAHQPLR
jgi:hypothetical protein